MRKIELAKHFWKRGIAALGILMGLALAPAPAQAQVCGDFGDIADDLLDQYLDEFEDFFGLSEKTCDSMTNTFYKGCTTAIKDAVKCWDRQLDTIPKAAKPACQEASKNPSSCNDFYKEEAQSGHGAIDNQADAATDDCGEAADEFFADCRFGIP